MGDTRMRLCGWWTTVRDALNAPVTAGWSMPSGRHDVLEGRPMWQVTPKPRLDGERGEHWAPDTEHTKLMPVVQQRTGRRP